MRTSVVAVIVIGAPVVGLMSACTRHAPVAEPLRPVRTAEISYVTPCEMYRYVGTVQARYVVDQAFRVGGKVVERHVDVGDVVHEGDVIAVLDDTDYRLAVAAAQQQLNAAVAQARQADSDQKRLTDLKLDGSVSTADDEHAQSGATSAQAAAKAQAESLELARNQLKYTVLRASRSGVVSAVRFEIGQVVAPGQPVVSIAGEDEPEIVVDVPEDQLDALQKSRFVAWLASDPATRFEMTLRELSPEAAPQTRTYRARFKPLSERHMPLGATATLLVDHVMTDSTEAVVPAAAITQRGGRPALWVVRRDRSAAVGTVSLLGVDVHGYKDNDVLISGPLSGTLVVVAGVQKMAPGLRVALSP